MQDQSITMTAACEVFGRHVGQGPAACKGVVLSLTDAHGSACSCSCHGQAVDLPAAFAEVVTLFPPCHRDGAA